MHEDPGQSVDAAGPFRQIPDDVNIEVQRLLSEADELQSRGDFHGNQEVLGRAIALIDGAVGPRSQTSLRLRFEALTGLDDLDPNYDAKLSSVYLDSIEVLGTDDSLTQRVRDRLARRMRRLGRNQEALPLVAEQVRVTEAADRDDRQDFYLGTLLDFLSELHEAVGDPFSTATVCRRYLEIESTVHPGSPGITGGLIRERLARAEAEMTRRPPPVGASTPSTNEAPFRLLRLINYLGPVPPDPCCPVISPSTRRVVLDPGESELWVQPSAHIQYEWSPWENAPVETLWISPAPGAVVVTDRRIAFVCYRFIGPQVGRDFVSNRQSWLGLGAGFLASSYSQGRRNIAAARQERGKAYVGQLPLDGIATVSVIPIAEPSHGLYGGIRLHMVNAEEDHCVAFVFPAPLAQLRDLASWLAEITLRCRLHGSRSATLLAEEIDLLEIVLGSLSPEIDSDGQLDWYLPVARDRRQL